MKSNQFIQAVFLLAALILGTAPSDSQAEITNDLIVWLNFDKNTQDASGNNHHARIIGSPAFIEGRTGSHALQFDGANDCVSLGRVAPLNFGAKSDFSISLWVKTKGWTSDPPLITNKAWENGQNPGWGIFATGDGKWKVNIGDGKKRADRDGGIINTDEWTHIAVTFERGLIAALYQNGARLNTLDIAGIGNIDSGLSTVIAQDGGLRYPHYFSGAIDDVSIWRRVLSANEIRDIYITGMAGLKYTTPQKPAVSLPLPPDTARDVSINTTLQWRAARGAKAYNVYFCPDSKAIGHPDSASPAFQLQTEALQFTPKSLTLGNAYFWRVDAMMEDKTVNKGDIWYFETKHGPIAQWRFDSIQEERPMILERVHSRNGMLEGPARFGSNPKSLIFNGATNRLPIIDIVSAPMFSKPAMTVEATVYIDPETSQGAIAAAKNWNLGYDNFQFTFNLSLNDNAAELRSATRFITENWYHIAAVYDGFTIKMYVNGILDSKIKLPSTQSDRIHPLDTIGAASKYTKSPSSLFKGRLLEISVFNRALDDYEITTRFEAVQPQFPKPLQLPFGLYLQFTSPNSAVARFHTETPGETVIEYGLESPSEHRAVLQNTNGNVTATLKGLRPHLKYMYVIKTRIDGAIQCTTPFECDNYFNYSLPLIPDRPSPYPSDNGAATLAERILQKSQKNKGYCLVLGCGDGRLVYELAKQSNLFVHGVDTNPTHIAEARNLLKQAGVYGARTSARCVDTYETLPFNGCFANIIVTDQLNETDYSANAQVEIMRVLRPNGGLLYLCHSEKIKARLIPFERPALSGAGVWSHQYGDPSNAANSYDTLQGATETDALNVQWIGRPGPRAMVDRNPRKPAPLAVNGRLFTQGLHRIIAQDAYNGAILWSLEIPNIHRFNIPRDCGNWCADNDYLYAAVADKVWKIDAETGRLIKFFDIVKPFEENFDWGYIASVNDTLFGSALKEGTVYTNFRGGSTTGWADATSGPITYKVCSDNLFAVKKQNGDQVWTYSQGVIINSTITIADGHVYFVECRNKDVKASPDRRLGSPEFWSEQYLVKLNADTGDVIWEKPLNTVEGTIVFYLLYTNGTLLLGLSQKEYHLYAYDAGNGDEKWHVQHKWIKDNHGQHMQHPAVVGAAVYLRPRGYSISDGTLLTKNMPPHEGGCATFCGTTGVLIYRGKQGAISMWDVNKETVSYWFSIRPGCWLSTISAGGMVLSPEGGGGCSCGGWLETSIGFIPHSIN